MRHQRAMTATEPSDEQLMARVAAGSQEALGPLYSRYARLVFTVAAHTLERASAEEIMQEVFLVVWRRAALFDPRRGSFRAWVLRITHFRVLNELRRRSRRPEIAPDPDHSFLAELPDDALPASERLAADERRAVVRAALAALPEAQRRALRLAVLEERTHTEVAEDLAVPLGTAKTRIRAGLQKLRGSLAARAASVALVAVVVALGLRQHALREDLARDDRALTMLTASDMENLRLAPAPGMPDATHARYRGRAGATIAVVTLSSFPPAPAGTTYQIWVRHDDAWRSLGTTDVDAAGHARLVAEHAELATPPDAVEITVEPRGGAPVPRGPVAASWRRASDAAPD